MGCGASSTAHDTNFGLSPDEANGEEKEGIVRAVSKARMESRYPWELDGRPLPEDLTIIFVLGGPGSGKSTQCQHLVKEKGVTHLSSGDLLRQEVDLGSALGRWCADLMKEGLLVPVQVTMTLLKKAMLNAMSPVILIDGFPRALDQVLLFEKSITPCHAVFFLDVSVEAAQERLAGRAAVSGRLDDNEHSVEQQWAVFQEQTLPVREHFKAKGKAVIIDAGRGVGEVAADVMSAFTTLEQRREVELSQPQVVSVKADGHVHAYEAAHKGAMSAGLVEVIASNEAELHKVHDSEEEEDSSY